MRFNVIYPVIYTRFDGQGMPFDQKPSRSVNVSLGGLRLRGSFPIGSGEIVEITIALADSLVTFMGEVVYVMHSRDQAFEMGISIRAIQGRDRIKLSWFMQRILESNLYH